MEAINIRHSAKYAIKALEEVWAAAGREVTESPYVDGSFYYQSCSERLGRLARFVEVKYKNRLFTHVNFIVMNSGKLTRSFTLTGEQLQLALNCEKPFSQTVLRKLHKWFKFTKDAKDEDRPSLPPRLNHLVEQSLHHVRSTLLERDLPVPVPEGLTSVLVDSGAF